MNILDEPERFRSKAYLDVLDSNTADQVCSIHVNSMQTMRACAEQGYPLEVCGLLIGQMTAQGWSISEARTVPNLNTDRATDRFVLDPHIYQQVDHELRGSGQEIIGIYHSHPDCPAKPSPTDLSNAWDAFAYIIISVCAEAAVDIRCWMLNDDRNKFQTVVVKES